MLPSTRLLNIKSPHTHIHISSSPKFITHVANRPRPPILRSLHYRVNNHGDLSSSLVYSRVPSFRTPRTRIPPRLTTPFPPSSSLLILHHVRPRPPLRFSPSAPSTPTPFTHTHTHTFTNAYALPASSRMFVSSERLSRLSSAWRHTPMKWNPLPWFVGALLLVLFQYRRYRLEKEVHVDEDGHEVIKLKGPWQVCKCPHCLNFFFPWPVSSLYSHLFHCTWQGFRPSRYRGAMPILSHFPSQMPIPPFSSCPSSREQCRP